MHCSPFDLPISRVTSFIYRFVSCFRILNQTRERIVRRNIEHVRCNRARNFASRIAHTSRSHLTAHSTEIYIWPKVANNPTVWLPTLCDPHPQTENSRTGRVYYEAGRLLHETCAPKLTRKHFCVYIYLHDTSTMRNSVNGDLS